MIRQELNVSLHSRLKLRKRLKIKSLVNLPTIPLHRSFRVVVRERQHSTSSMLDQHYLSRPEQMLRDQNGPESVFRVASGVADNVGVAERYPEGCGWIDAGVHAGYWVM